MLVSVSTGRSAAFFDLDKTIIAKSSALAFSGPFFAGGLLSRRAVLRSAYAQFMFAIGGADHDQLEKMRTYLAQMVTGWDAQTVRQLVDEALHEIINPIVFDEAVDLIEQHHAAGRDVVIISASGAEVVEPIGRLLGADHVIATQMVVEDGKYNGEISRYVYGPEKATAIRDLAEERGYDLEASYGYSDSETDAPMLEAVGRPYAVNPDRGLRRIAEERGWPILNFTRSVSLRTRLGLDDRTTVAAAVAVVTLVVVATAVLGRRRHRRTIQAR
jgi:HAD superfamily hydrolase (TIGR01490 family)